MGVRLYICNTITSSHLEALEIYQDHLKVAEVMLLNLSVDFSNNTKELTPKAALDAQDVRFSPPCFTDKVVLRAASLAVLAHLPLYASRNTGRDLFWFH